MRSIKPGRGPSAMGALGSIFAVIVGIGWTAMAVSMTSTGPDFGPFRIARVLFPLFGVCFVIFGIVSAIYNLRNARARDRYSIADITEPGEELDPLQARFDSSTMSTLAAKPAAYCPGCGAGCASDFAFCAACGRKLAS